MRIKNKWEEEFDVKVGDWVGFKCDIEQSGKVTAIRGDAVHLENKSGFHGDYIGGDTNTVVSKEDIWEEHE